MNLLIFSNRTNLSKLTTIGLAFGSTVLVTAPLSKPASAQTDVSNCPGIFYQEPFTSRVAAPAGCPLTEYQQQLQITDAVPLNSAVPNSNQVGIPPLPEEVSEAIAIASPINNQLNISLMNNTGTVVTYEVVGDTTRRELMPDESAMLQEIPLPSTITLVRQDDGLLDVAAMDTEEGMLQLSLSAEGALDDTQGVVRIQSDGQVFVN